MEIKTTACSRDCPDACSIHVGVENGEAVFLRGNPEHPVTRGYLCYRTGRFLNRQYASDRIREPLLRCGEDWQPLSWDEAFDRIERELRNTLHDSGPLGIAECMSGGSLGILKGLYRRFFRMLGPYTHVGGDICSGAGEAAQLADFGISESHGFFDLRASRNILLWGKNVGVGNIHLIPLLKERVRAGARLFYVDPVPPDPGLPEHLRLSPQPGRDLELAMGVAGLVLDRIDRPGLGSPVGIHGLERFEELCRALSPEAWADAAGMTLSELDVLADALLDSPTSIQIGWGLQRRRRGADTVRALDALAAISGNLGIEGGGASFYYGRRTAFHRELLREGHEPGRVLQQACLGADLSAAQDPPVGFLFVACANPVTMLPDSGAVAAAIESVPFVVVADTHFNDTVRRADLVLPVETMLEDQDLLGAFGHHYLTASTPVLERPPSVRSDLEIVQELARRLGLAAAFDGDRRTWMRRLMHPSLAEHSIELEDLEGGAVRNPLVPERLFTDGVVPTPSGKVELLDTYQEPIEHDTEYPLWMFSNAHRRSQCSQWCDGEDDTPLEVRVHPDAANGFEEGQLVRLCSRIASIEVTLRFDASLRRDILIIPKGGSFDLGRAANALVPAVLTDHGEGAAYMDAHVRIEASS